jgi:hypothetical protein
MDFKEFRRRIEIIQKAMVERGISENNDFDSWCDYREPAVSRVFQKTIDDINGACSWRTDSSLWIRETDRYHEWTFRSYDELTDAEIKEFCRIHDIMDLVPPEVYGESKLKLDVATEVEFMDI